MEETTNIQLRIQLRCGVCDSPLAGIFEDCPVCDKPADSRECSCKCGCNRQTSETICIDCEYGDHAGHQ